MRILETGGRPLSRAEAFGKAPALPSPLGFRVGYDLKGIPGRAAGMTARMGGCYRLTRGSSRGPGAGILGFPGGGVGGKRRGSDLTEFHSTPNPGPRRFQSQARPIISRAFLLEGREDAFGAGDGPKNQRGAGFRVQERLILFRFFQSAYAPVRPPRMSLIP